MKTPGNWTVAGLFGGRPEALALFELVRQYIELLGPVTMEVMKTQISFAAKTKFAWVWLLQMWTKKRPDHSITMTFNIDRHIVHERIAAAVGPRPDRWTHHVVLENESDFNEDVRNWLEEAYIFSQNKK